MRPAVDGNKPKDPKAWAWLLKERYDAGEILSAAQNTMWRAVVGNELRPVVNDEDDGYVD